MVFSELSLKWVVILFNTLSDLDKCRIISNCNYFAAELAFNSHSFPFPDGQERVVMRTPVDDVQLTFTTEQWENFHAAMDEAAFMQEIYNLMEGE